MGEQLRVILERLNGLWVSFLKHLPQFLIGLVVIGLTWAVARLLSGTIVKALARTRLRRSIHDLLAKLVAAVIWLAGIMAAAVIVFPSLTPAKFFTVFGLSSVAIGFAFKDVFENFLAGVVILLRDTVEIGDVVNIDGTVGRVESITVRDTHIRMLDGERVVMPNALLFKNPLRILTDRDVRRVTVGCGVGYGEDVDKSRDVIREAVASVESVSRDEPIEVFAREFGASSIDFEVTWWTGSSPLDVRQSRDEVIAAVKNALDEAGIEIPFPYRTLTFKEPLVTERAQPAEESA